MYLNALCGKQENAVIMYLHDALFAWYSGAHLRGPYGVNSARIPILYTSHVQICYIYAKC